jgi:hypothetical protein
MRDITARQTAISSARAHGPEQPLRSYRLQDQSDPTISSNSCSSFPIAIASASKSLQPHRSRPGKLAPARPHGPEQPLKSYRPQGQSRPIFSSNSCGHFQIDKTSASKYRCSAPLPTRENRSGPTTRSRTATEIVSTTGSIRPHYPLELLWVIPNRHGQRQQSLQRLARRRECDRNLPG